MGLTIMNRKQRFYFNNRLLSRYINEGVSFSHCMDLLRQMEVYIHTPKMQAVHDDAVAAVAAYFPEEFPNYVIVG